MKSVSYKNIYNEKRQMRNFGIGWVKWIQFSFDLCNNNYPLKFYYGSF